MRTDEEILKRIQEIKNKDVMRDETGDLVCCLQFENAKTYLNPSAIQEKWRPTPHSRDDMIVQITNYMAFAWEKANNCRGLSARRSLDHMRAWLWLAGEDDFLEKLDYLEEYTHYGKPQLRAICEYFDINWKEYDDGEWRNNENDAPVEPF